MNWFSKYFSPDHLATNLEQLVCRSTGRPFKCHFRLTAMSSFLSALLAYVWQVLVCCMFSQLHPSHVSVTTQAQAWICKVGVRQGQLNVKWVGWWGWLCLSSASVTIPLAFTPSPPDHQSHRLYKTLFLWNWRWHCLTMPSFWMCTKDIEFQLEVLQGIWSNWETVSVFAAVML